ncbi:MAG TPA: hypothetical protein VFQ35_09400, partial [Polyangiaceae bacterium]|nr:hypothetical protein [Polyangiaceae bacterium]
LPAELDGEVLRAAREVETGRPRPLATLVPASEPIVPTPFVTHLRVSLTLSQNLKSAPTAANAESHTSVELGSAVFAEGSSGGSEVSLEGERYRVQVRLSTDTPSDPANGYRTETYRGKLEVRVEDEHGRSFRRILPVSGLVELDGPGAIAAMGLEVPMYLSSDEEQNPRLGALEERGSLPRVQILVSSVLTAEEFE